MSSHREAAEIGADPVAAGADLYAFVSPDRPDTVTVVSTWVPAGPVAAGADHAEFGADVLYEIHLDLDGDARPDLTYQFRFRTELRDDRTFLYNTGPIESLDSGNWNRRQFYSVTRVDRDGRHTVLARRLPCPPCHVGSLSIPDYDGLARAAVHRLDSGERVFAGQRAEAGRTDHADLLGPGILPGPADRPGTVQCIAVQVPRSVADRDGTAVIGVWAAAGRRQVRVRSGDDVEVGPQVQVSRTGTPLFADLFLPAAERDRWNALPPSADRRFVEFVERPVLATLLPAMHPGRFDRLAALTATGRPRTDLVALLLTGFPDGLVDGFRTATGNVPADVLRLDTAVPPARAPRRSGLLGGDPAGFPNGRRITDDVVSVLLRAIAGATVPLVDPGYRPDPAALPDTDGPEPVPAAAFPYLPAPIGDPA